MPFSRDVPNFESLLKKILSLNIFIGERGGISIFEVSEYVSGYIGQTRSKLDLAPLNVLVQVILIKKKFIIIPIISGQTRNRPALAGGMN